MGVGGGGGREGSAANTSRVGAIARCDLLVRSRAAGIARCDRSVRSRCDLPLRSGAISVRSRRLSRARVQLIRSRLPSNCIERPVARQSGENERRGAREKRAGRLVSSRSRRYPPAPFGVSPSRVCPRLSRGRGACGGGARRTGGALSFITQVEREQVCAAVTAQTQWWCCLVHPVPPVPVCGRKPRLLSPVAWSWIPRGAASSWK